MANSSDQNDQNQKIDDILSYPILTEEVGFPAVSRPGTSSGSGTGQLGQIAEGPQFGRSWAGDRRRGTRKDLLRGALTQAFSFKEVDGHTEWTWTPRTSPYKPDMDYHRSAGEHLLAPKAAIDQSLPLLDGLYPLRSDFDREDAEVPSDGPPELADPQTIQGQLGELRDRLGLKPKRVNTVEKEQNLTNFMILVNHVDTLSLSWNAMRQLLHPWRLGCVFGDADGVAVAATRGRDGIGAGGLLRDGFSFFLRGCGAANNPPRLSRP